MAAASVQSAISSLVEAITAATKQVHVVKSQDSEVGNAIQERQLNVNALAQAVTTLLMNISGALNNVISALGLSTSSLSKLHPNVHTINMFCSPSLGFRTTLGARSLQPPAGAGSGGQQSASSRETTGGWSPNWFERCARWFGFVNSLYGWRDG